MHFIIPYCPIKKTTTKRLLLSTRNFPAGIAGVGKIVSSWIKTSLITKLFSSIDGHLKRVHAKAWSFSVYNTYWYIDMLDFQLYKLRKLYYWQSHLLPRTEILCHKSTFKGYIPKLFCTICLAWDLDLTQWQLDTIFTGLTFAGVKCTNETSLCGFN